jgi:hypothetical protein
VAASRLTADTSVIVPSILSWHALHSKASAALAEVRQVPAHALVESFSVLTRLPAPRALRPAQAQQALLRAFPEPPLILGARGHLAIILLLAEGDIGGGRVYDAVVGGAAAEAKVRLLTADRRALPTYALVGAEFELLQ